MFLSPLGLLALLGVPAVAGLYLFRRKVRPRRVSALFLWDAPDESPSTGRKVERLRNEASLLCELAMALLLGLLVAGPRGCGSTTATHVVCVLDGSASMGATDADGSAAERATAWLAAELDGLAARSLATIVVSGARPTLLAGPAVPVGEALVALEDYRPTRPGHDLGPALDLARELARDGRVLVATDHFDVALADERTHLRSFGRPAANVGIVHAVRERDRTTGDDVAWVTVQNFSADAATRTVRATARYGSSEEPLELAPMERRTVRLPIAAFDATARVALAPADALAVDDEVQLAPTPPRTLAVHVALPATQAESLGLDARGERWTELVGDAVVALSPADAHLSLGASPLLGPNAWTWEFADGADTAWVGPFLFDRAHPLVEGVALEGTVWMGAGAGAAPPGTPIVSSGDRTLLAETVTGERRALVANLDPRASNLTRSPDWPILLSNWSEARRAELPGPALTSLVQGETLTWRGLADGTYRLEEPGGGTRDLEVAGRLVIDALAEVGDYVLRAPDGDEVGRFTVRFEDASESNLRTRLAGERETSRIRAEVETRHDPLPTVLWALVLGLGLFDVFVLRPRGAASGGPAT